jgi:hypothetical protein
MLIKNTNPNELLAEFERDKNFCPYNEEELERLKERGERLRKDVTCDIGFWHGTTYFSYGLLRIADKEVRYEYGEYGSIRRISLVRSEEQTEYVLFEDWGKIVFFYKIYNLDGTDWSVKVDRTGDLNQEVRLLVGDEVKFSTLGY